MHTHSTGNVNPRDGKCSMPPRTLSVRVRDAHNRLPFVYVIAGVLLLLMNAAQTLFVCCTPNPPPRNEKAVGTLKLLRYPGLYAAMAILFLQYFLLYALEPLFEVATPVACS